MRVFEPDLSLCIGSILELNLVTNLDKATNLSKTQTFGVFPIYSSCRVLWKCFHFNAVPIAHSIDTKHFKYCRTRWTCIIQKPYKWELLRARLFLKSTCRHNIGGMVRNRQALCGAVMHYQRQRGRRVRIQGYKGVRWSKRLASHTLQQAREPLAPVFWQNRSCTINGSSSSIPGFLPAYTYTGGLQSTGRSCAGIYTTRKSLYPF